MRWVPSTWMSAICAIGEETDDSPDDHPQMMEELVFEQALPKALRLAFIQHKSFATVLKGVQQQRTIADAFDQSSSGQTLVNMMSLNMLIGSGGVLSHAPRRNRRADDDRRVPAGGITRLAVDSIFMMPQLGVLAEVHPGATKCLIRTASFIWDVYSAGWGIEIGQGRDFGLHDRASRRQGGKGHARIRTMKLFPLGFDEAKSLPLTQRRPLSPRGFDLGSGKGAKVERTFRAELSTDSRRPRRPFAVRPMM